MPMAARVVNKVGLEADKYHFLLMHAMGLKVAGVIGGNRISCRCRYSFGSNRKCLNGTSA